MTPDLSSYPSTPRGVEKITKDLLPTMVRLWKRSRACMGDDVVAVVNARTNNVQFEARAEVYNQLKTRNPDLDFLPRLMTQAPGPGAPVSLGSVRIWVIVGFTDGRVGLRSLTLARS